ncbi:MAG: T9SS type A sorting domain-containing protein [Psychroserpens sp.]|uniref:T9SS type A sorting domain-containing protein n=1 Tax=Psychroserpens sp. TaxID=2020870 RepID=UPI003C874E3B
MKLPTKLCYGLLFLAPFYGECSIIASDYHRNSATVSSETYWTQVLASNQNSDDVENAPIIDHSIFETSDKPDAILNISYINSSQTLEIIAADALDIQDIRLYSILGQKVKEWINIKPNSYGRYLLTLDHLTKGTYLVIVKTKSGQFNKRLIINP